MNIQPHMSEREKKRKRIYDLLVAETKHLKSFQDNSCFFTTWNNPTRIIN